MLKVAVCWGDEVAVMVPREMVLVGVLVFLVAVVGREAVVVTCEEAVCSALRVVSEDRVLVPPGSY